MKKVIGTMLLSMLLVTIAGAAKQAPTIPGSGDVPLRRIETPKTLITKPPYPDVKVEAQGNAAGYGDKDTGGVLLGAAGDRRYPSPDKVDVMFKSNTYQHLGRLKGYSGRIVMEVAFNNWGAKFSTRKPDLSGHAAVVELRNSLGNAVPLIHPDTNSTASRVVLPLRDFTYLRKIIVSKKILSPGNYSVWAGFRAFSADKGYSFMGNQGKISGEEWPPLTNVSKIAIGPQPTE